MSRSSSAITKERFSSIPKPVTEHRWSRLPSKAESHSWRRPREIHLDHGSQLGIISKKRAAQAQAALSLHSKQLTSFDRLFERGHFVSLPPIAEWGTYLLHVRRL